MSTLDDAAAYAVARADAARSLRETQRVAEEQDGASWRLLAATSGMLAEMLGCYSPFAAMAGRQIQACFCPPMLDASDPEQHGVGCLHAQVLFRERAFARDRDRGGASGGCYRASFGWVHVRPGCRCRGRR